MHFGPNSYAAATLQWKHHVERGRAQGAELGPDRYLEVRYEQLVGTPEDVLSRVCEFLALDMRADVLQYHEHADQFLSGMHRTDHSQGLYRPPARAEAGWAEKVSPGDVAVFELLAGDLRAELGDPPAPRPPTLANRARAAWARSANASAEPLRRLRYRAIRRRRARSLRNRTLRSG
jgi:hypothetical protein